MSDTSAAETSEATETSETGDTASETEAARGRLSPEEYEKRLDAQKRDLREQRGRIRSLEEMIRMKGAEPVTRAEKAAEPNIDEDPIAWMKYAKTRLEGFDAERTADEERTKREQAQSGEVAQIAQRMQEFEKDYRDDHPDYDDAVAHFRKVRTEELGDEGVSGAEMNNALVQELVSIVARAVRAGKDPADVIYKLSKKRGFGVDGSTKKLQTIERAQQAGKSLSQAGGRQGDGELTYEYVSSLKGEEFRKAFQKLRAQEKRRA